MEKEPKLILEKFENEQETIQDEFSRHVSDENARFIEQVEFYGQPGATAFSEWFGTHILKNYPPEFRSNFNFENVKLHKDGELFKKLIENKNFIDLGCGHPGLSKAPRTVARALGAKKYIGVDQSKDTLYQFFIDNKKEKELIDITDKQGKYVLQDKLGPMIIEKEDGFESMWIQDDMLGFVSKIKEADGVVFFLAGIQEYGMEEESRQASSKYFDALGQELGRITHKGDAIIFSGNVQPIGYEKILEYGFRRLTSEESEGYDLTGLVVFIRE